MSALRRERGQVLTFSVLFLTAVLGMAALVLDVGSWFRADRRLQATADAAALAGAQALPSNPASAYDLALDYAARNGGGVAAEDIAISTGLEPNDEITIHAHGKAEAFFSRLFDVLSVDVGGYATARADRLAKPRWVAPIAVDEHHPLLQCKPELCFDQQTQLNLFSLKGGGSTAAGAFGLIDLDRVNSGSSGNAAVADWIRTGYPDALDLGIYYSEPGAEFNSSAVKAALEERIGDELLFPVYRSIVGAGANARYDVIGWVGFTLQSFSGQGSTGTVGGRFTRVTWEGVPAAGSSDPDFGVRTISLVR